jgi:hypothetical protein
LLDSNPPRGKGMGQRYPTSRTGSQPAFLEGVGLRGLGFGAEA